MNRQETENASPKRDLSVSNFLHLDVKSENVNFSGGVTHGEKTISSRGFGRDLCVEGARMSSSTQSSSRIERRSNRRFNRLEKEKRVQESTTSDAASGTDKCVVSDDDDSVCNRSKHVQVNSKRKRVEVTASQPLTPLPLKLKTSQIHSKKYNFPQKLFDLLTKASSDCQSSDIVSWKPDGNTFIVHDHARFAAEFLPTYFGHTQFRSFDRQLNYWGFELVSPRTINNKSFGGKSWKHPFFQKDRRDLLQKVARKLVRGSPSSQRVTPFNKGNKSRSVFRNVKKASGRVKNDHKNNDESNIEENNAGTVSCSKDSKMYVKEALKGASTMICLPPRMVSPVHGSRYAEAIRNPVQGIILSALDVVERKFDGQISIVPVNGETTVSDNVEDAFLPLFPLEVLDRDTTYKQKLGVTESIGTTDFAPFVDVKTMMKGSKGNHSESCQQVDVFEGNSFHDVDLTMDVSIDMDMTIDMSIDTIMDETDVLLNIVEDIDSSNGDDYFSP